MTYDLFIGDRMFSSWSLRGWLMFEKFGLSVTVHETGLYSGTFTEDMAPLAPARFVPALRTDSGEIIGESLAIAETLAERHPEAGHWPADPVLRARARWLCAEMTSGFGALRSECPMQLSHVNSGFVPSPAVRADIARLELIWEGAWQVSGKRSGWLFGAYSLADVFFTPVAARIAGYGLETSATAADYVAQCLNDPAFKRWRAAAQATHHDPFPYPNFGPLGPWPTD